uniref:Uncharacterized protein n=1 Tax=Physcomitrium patens TaxID=3218 RepID=A0A2K1K2L5_PHYPA|nr:hypothetical protein PHYPA_012485 [Physcomitrium patens]
MNQTNNRRTDAAAVSRTEVFTPILGLLLHVCRMRSNVTVVSISLVLQSCIRNSSCLRSLPGSWCWIAVTLPSRSPKEALILCEICRHLTLLYDRLRNFSYSN